MLDNARPGPNHVNEYVVSPIPWVTSSTLPAGSSIRYDVPRIASSFSVQNYTSGSGCVLAVGFTQEGVDGTNRIRVKPGGSFSSPARFTSLFLKSVGSSDVEYELFMGLTTILSRDFPGLSGSFSNV